MASPVFKEAFFVFEEGSAAPEHIDDYPERQDRDPDLYHVEGYMPEDGDFVWLAINLEKPADAARLLEGATRKIREEIETGECAQVMGVALVRPGNEGVYASIDNPVLVATS